VGVFEFKSVAAAAVDEVKVKVEDDVDEDAVIGIVAEGGALLLSLIILLFPSEEEEKQFKLRSKKIYFTNLCLSRLLRHRQYQEPS
jgi:hypothetical protein